MESTEKLNKNGWQWMLVSTATPGAIRIQLGEAGDEETCWRRCVEAKTLSEAIKKAEQLVESINGHLHGDRMGGGMCILPENGQTTCNVINDA